jgi:alpha-tubulin suppressor-like RCC1 family protein
MNLRMRPPRGASAGPGVASGRRWPVVLGVCAAAVGLAAAGCTSSPDHLGAEATVKPLPPQTSVVEHWGAVFGGTPAPGFLDQENSPTTVKLPGIVAQVGSSNSDEYALLTNGSVYAWGMGTQGELGDGGDVNSFETPQQVRFPRGVKIAYLATDAMPYDTALAVDTQGHAWGWGNNSGGVFCLGNRHSYSTPVRLPFSGVTTLAGANAHALYDADGTVYACGSGLDGALGDGSTVSVTTPVRVPGLGGAKVVKLVAAFENSGALLTDGEYLDWGYNANGQLGDGQVGGFSDVPVRVNFPHPVVQVAQGGSTWGNGQTLALLGNGELWVWGADYAGQLDTGTAGPGAAVPLEVSLPAGTTVSGLATGSGTCYVITRTGAVYAWGANYAGQVGNGKTQQASAPVMVATGATQISSTANNAVIDTPSARN